MSLSSEWLDSLVFKVVCTTVASLLSWRLWRFTLRPKLCPNEPRELPYWIPFIGHAGSFFRDFSGATAKGRKYFGPSREPFSMTVAGETIYIATSPKDVGHVWRHSETISMDPISMDMYKMVLLNERQRELMFDSHPGARYNAGNKKPLNPTQMVIELHQQQLLPGARLDEHMHTRILPSMFQHLSLSSSTHPAVVRHSEKSVIISLNELVVDIFVKAATEAYFGPKILQIAPNMIQSFMGWEHVNWKLIFSLPPFLSQDMIAVKQALVDAFARYYELPREQRPDAAFFVTAFEDMFREIGFDEEAMGKMLLLHYWATFGNVYKLGFWVVAYLTQQPVLVEEIRNEVLPAVKEQLVDEKYLLEKCPKLESLVSETLRLSVTSSLARVLMETSVVGGKTLQKGRKVMLPIRELHYDEQVWGDSPDTLHPNRFIENPKLSKHLGYRPWGGGHTLCPGRFLARRSVNAFLAILLSKYELGVESSTFPKNDGARPSPGVIPWKEGQDLLLRVTPREDA